MFPGASAGQRAPSSRPDPSLDFPERRRMAFPRSALILAASAILVLGVPGRAAAQAADTTAPPLKGSIDLGPGGRLGEHRPDDLQLRGEARVPEGQVGRPAAGQDGLRGDRTASRSANEYLVFVQPSYALSERWKGYVLGSWDRNTFIGISQRWQEGRRPLLRRGARSEAFPGPRRRLLVLPAGLHQRHEHLVPDGARPGRPTSTPSRRRPTCRTSSSTCRTSRTATTTGSTTNCRSWRRWRGASP